MEEPIKLESTFQFIDHTALLCSEISFYHPFLNKTLTFKVPFPKDFEELANKLL